MTQLESYNNIIWNE